MNEWKVSEEEQRKEKKRKKREKMLIYDGDGLNRNGKSEKGKSMDQLVGMSDPFLFWTDLFTLSLSSLSLSLSLPPPRTPLF